MKTRWYNPLALTGTLLLAAFLWPGLVQVAIAAEASTKILVIAGPCEHAPGTHEAAAGARLLEHCVKNAANVEPVLAEMLDAWPADKSTLDGVATIVFIGDIFPPERMDQPEKIMADLARLMDRGCGIVCLHYATGLRAQHVSEDGDHPLLKWMGGYFAAGCPHHRSVARVCTSTITPAEGEHPVLRGWREFTFDDEPYWNNYFGKDGMSANVVPLACSMLPPEKPQKEVIAWAVERADGGRGVGIVLPHYYRNWKVSDLRTLVLNAVFWSAKLDVPAQGVQAPLSDLSAFQPGSVDPKPRPKRKAKTAK
ncbi:MAG: ThuA domain-containing protein [Planctomycetota bacterium]|jgi:type 1 glutamine amidotransferase